MKKTLAILLSCMLIVCAICAVALTTNAEAVPASAVTVTTTAGETTLNSTTTSVTGITGTATFDAATGTLTLDGTSGITKIYAADTGVLTVKVVGTNTVGGTSVDHTVWNNNGALAVTGTGTLNIQGTQYVFGAIGDVTVDGPTVNTTSTTGTNVHIGAAADDGVLTLKGNSVVTVTNNGGGDAIDLAGITPKLVVTDNVKLTVSTSGTAINIRVTKNPTAAIPKCSATAEISGKAQVNVLKGNQALQTIIKAEGLSNTGFVASVTIKDEASFTSKTSGQGIVVNADYNAFGTDKAVLQILDKANVDIECYTGSGQYSQGIDVRGGYGTSGSSDVDITTTGTVRVKSNAHGWNGAVIFRGKAGHDILIKDVKMNIENVPSNYHQVSVGFYCQVKANSLVISGDAEITVSAKQDTFETMVAQGADKTNRANGFYIAAGTSATVKDNAKINASVGGNAAKSWAAGAAAIYNNGSTLKIQDNAVVTGTAAGNAIPAYVSQQGNLTVTGNGKLNLDGSLNGILFNNDTTKAKETITVTEGGLITAKGGTASVAKNNDHYTIDAAQKGAFTDKTIIFAAKTVAAPTNVAASDVTANSAKITWTAVPGAVSYKVYSGANLVATVTATEATIDTLPSTAYSVTVKAVNAADAESAASAAATFTTPAGQSTVVIPAAPTNVKVSSISQTSAKVTWSAVEGATGYNVYLGTNKVASVTTTEAALSDLTAETAYDVTVTATNVAGESAASAKASFKTAVKNGAASVDVILADANNTKVTLTADAPSTNGTTGTIVFDPVESTVTLTDVTGVQAVIAATNVNLTYVIKGTNTLETASQTNVLRAYDLTVIGDGTLNVKSTKSSGAYTILGQKNITIGGDVTFNLENAAGTAMHVARGLVANADEDSACAFTFKDNAKIHVKTAAGNTVYGTGHKVSLIITGKADVKLECAGRHYQSEGRYHRKESQHRSRYLLRSFR